MALCLRRVSYLAVSVYSKRSSACSLYRHKGLCTFPRRQYCTTRPTGSTSVESLLKDITQCKLGETRTFQCLSELVRQAREQDSIKELQNDQRILEHLKSAAQEANTLSTTAIISYLRIYSNFRFLSVKHISPLVSVLTERLPNLNVMTTSKIAQYLLQFKEGKKLSKPFLFRSTQQYMDNITNGEYLNPNTISQHLHALHNGDMWPSTEERDKLQEYVIANASVMTLQSLSRVLSVMNFRQNMSFELLQCTANAATRILSEDVPVWSRIHKWGKLYPLDLQRLLQTFAKYKFYHEEFCSAITHVVLTGTEDTHLLSPRFLSTLAWCFASVCYYDSSLMDHIAHYSMDRLTLFSGIDLGNLVYGFGQLNHPHPELVNRVVENMFESPKKLNDLLLCWTVIWSAMVMDVCPERLLELAITEEFIDRSMQGIGFKPILLLPLSVAINIEHPELSLATCTSSSPFVRSKSWGTCIAGFNGVDSSHIRTAMLDRILYHSSSAHSFFSANVTRALKLVVGGTHYFNEEPLSLSGYSMDFEVLLNSKNQPITIPVQWKYRKVRTLLKSIGVMEIPSNTKFRETQFSDRLEAGNVDDGVQEPYGYNKTILYQIASDWGPRFADTAEPVARKVAIEADGLYHFARNCVHKLGKTTLKHRQLKSLGWEVLSIPQHEWTHLKTGDDHIYYLAKKLNINSEIK